MYSELYNYNAKWYKKKKQTNKWNNEDTNNKWIKLKTI